MRNTPSFPREVKYPRLARLRDHLATLYATPEAQDELLSQLGLDPAFIAWDPKPVNTWISILQQAAAVIGHNVLLTKIWEQHPDDPVLSEYIIQ